ncbi:MAG: hypothetical protein JSW61_11410 [Candidatus Thorarchaeota archaeon]|nr:MAG: hypothetical protein JSW61_11410 [Candidatus Thorarchaeota archaeon]
MAFSDNEQSVELCDYCGERKPTRWWSGLARKYCSKECNAADLYRFYAFMTCLTGFIVPIGIAAIVTAIAEGRADFDLFGLIQFALTTVGAIAFGYLTVIGYRAAR